MYKKILIATDGSKLAGKAVKHGIAFAKALDAKVTALTVTEPFPVFAVNPAVLTDTLATYKVHAKQYAEVDPFRGFRRRQGGGRCVQHRACRERASL